MFRSGVTIPDDRGRQVPVFDLMDRGVVGASDMRDDPELAEAVTRISEAMLQGEALNRTLTARDVVPLLAAGLTIPVVAIVMSQAWSSAPTWTIFVVVGPLLGACTWWYAHRRHREVAARMAGTLLAYGRCASCGYSMRGAIAEPDGAQLCPECGAAWKADRVGTLQLNVPATASTEAPSPALRTPWSFTSTWHRTPSVEDARGRAVSLIHPARLRDELPATLGAHRVANVRRAVSRQTLGSRIGLGCLSCCALLALVVAVLGVIRGKATSWWMLATFIIWLPGLVVGGWRLLAGRSQWTARATCQAILSEGLCPSCGEDLVDKERQADGATICKCGAAWTVSAYSGTRET